MISVSDWGIAVILCHICSVQVTEWMFDLANKLDNLGKYTEPGEFKLLFEMYIKRYF